MSDRSGPLPLDLGDLSVAALEEAFGDLPLGLALLGPDGRFSFAFGPDLRAMGLRSGLLRGVHYSDLRPLWPELEPLVGLALAGETRSLILPWRGRPRHLLLGPLQLPEGRGAVIASMDLSTALEQEHRQVREERMTSLARLAGGLAHELNNLFAVAAIASELMGEALADEGPRHIGEQLLTIDRAIERGVRLTRQLAAMAGRMQGPARVVDVGDCLRPLPDFLRGLERGRCELLLVEEEERLRVRIPEGVLEQVVLSMVHQACAQMAGGGLVELRLRSRDLEQDPELPAGRYVSIVVQDRGPALAPDEQDHLFEPFSRPLGRGGGLGLASSYGLVLQAGGRLRSRVLETGNQTEVLLPLCVEEPEALVGPEEDEGAPRADGARVVLVEDEVLLREQLEQFLLTSGHAVLLSTGDGQEALEWIRERPGVAEVVLSDVILPGISGLELARRLDGVVPVVLMSGFLGEELPGVREAGRQATILSKPARPDEILGALARAVRARR